MTVAGVVLAAGEGRRLGQPKAVVSLAGQPLVRRAVWTLHRAGVDPVVVVTGAAHAQVVEALAGWDVEVVHNPDWPTGMGSSLRAALAHLSPRVEIGALVMALVDTPGLTAASVEAVVERWRTRGVDAVVATYDGRRGHPVLLAREVWGEVADLARGDTGARAWLVANPTRVDTVACDQLADPGDLDTPDALDLWQTWVRRDRPRTEHSMELEHTFDVPVPPSHAFEVLRDIRRIGPCMPGATIDDVDGDHFSGRVKVKIGPIQVTYRGEADYTDVDTDGLTASINARGREARGSGTANAVVRARVTDGPDGGARVNVVTDLAITGKPAQFGRGVMDDVGEKLITQFADCLAEELAKPEAEEEPATAAVGAPTGNGQGGTPSTGAPDTGAEQAESGAGNGQARQRPAPTPAKEGEAIDLLEIAGAPVAQRLAPLVIGAIVLYVLYRLLGRRRTE